MNAEKSFFVEKWTRLSRFIITREDIMPLPDKVEAIKNKTVPITKKQSQNFIGLIIYYRDMCTISSMTSKQAYL